MNKIFLFAALGAMLLGLSGCVVNDPYSNYIYPTGCGFRGCGGGNCYSMYSGYGGGYGGCGSAFSGCAPEGCGGQGSYSRTYYYSSPAAYVW